VARLLARLPTGDTDQYRAIPSLPVRQTVRYRAILFGTIPGAAPDRKAAGSIPARRTYTGLYNTVLYSTRLYNTLEYNNRFDILGFNV